MKAAIRSLSRYVATARDGKHRLFMWQPPSVVPDSQVVAITRADDTTFGILHSRLHELWSLRMCTWLGVGNDPRYTPTTCFETFPFPTGLTPADTAHQLTETLEGGAVIPYFPAGNIGETGTEAGMGRMSGAISKSEAYEPPASAPSPPAAVTDTDPSPPAAATHRQAATAIAIAAHRLNALREAWLNPPEWTQRVPEVVPLGLDASPYPDRIEPKPGLGEADLQALKKRTLTNLYNLSPAWLTIAHH